MSTRLARLARNPAAWIVLLTVAALALRLWRLDFQSLWRDEADAIYFATQPWAALAHMFTSNGDNGPLYFLALRGWIALFGRSEAAVRGFSVLPGVLLVPAVEWLGRRLGGAAAGVLAAAFATFSPYLVWYSQEAKMYAWVALLGTLALAGLWRGLEGGRARWWALYVIASTLALWMHLLAVLLIPAGAALYLLARRGPAASVRPRPYLISLAALTLPYVPLAWWQARAFAAAFHTGRPSVPLPQMVAALAVAWTSGVAAPGVSPLLQQILPFLTLFAALFLVLAAWALVAHGRQARVVAALAAWMLLPVLLLFLISLRTPLFNERYLIFGAPALYLLMGCGAVAAWARWRGIAVAAVAVLLMLFAGGIASQGTTILKADWRDAAAFVHARGTPGDAVFLLIPQTVHAFDYYYRAPYPAVDAANALGQSASSVADALSQATAGRDAVWLVLSDSDTWDPQGLTAAWFRAGWRIAAEASLTRVQVVRFVR